jgi:uncharacterized protein
VRRRGGTVDPMTADQPQPFGTIFMPSGAGTPVGRFEFLVDVEHGGAVEIGTMVAADTGEGVVVGVVVDMRTVGTDADPVRAETSRVPHPDRIGYLPAVKCAQVQVLAAKSLRSVGPGVVRPATVDEVAEATGQANMEWPIPIGALKLANGDTTPVCVDGTFLVGPEAQGLGVFGRSGVASKTSFMTVAVRSVLNAGGEMHRSAAVLFNVKGEDLVWIDQPAEASAAPTAEDLALYDAMGVPATPFDDVEVWAPAVLDGGPARSTRADARSLSWDLADVWRYLRLFIPNLYDDDKLSAFVAQFEDLLLHHKSAAQRVDTFEKLDAWFRAEIDAYDAARRDGDKSEMVWDGRLHIATARRLRRTFAGLQARGQGLFCRGKAGPADDIPITGWRHGQVLVVDLAGLSSEVQGFVIARTVDRLMTAAEQGTLGEVDHVIAAMDEGAAITEHPTVRRSLQRVATQGRYAGVALFIATQAASKLDDALRDNSATRAVGSSAETELATGVHGRLPVGLLERLATMPKGQMAVWHTGFRQSIVVRFPRPAWRMGKSRTTAGSRPTATSLLREHLGDKAYERAASGVGAATAERLAAGAGSVEDAAAALQAAGDQTPRAVHAPRSFDPDNPFSLD